MLYEVITRVLAETEQNSVVKESKRIVITSYSIHYTKLYDEKIRLGKLVSDHFESAQKLYNELLSQGIAKECARFVLPLATPTRIYMTGNVRDWIHYIDLRSANGTQKEHREIALGCREIFIQEFPVCAEALEWK